ncbi:hypothetical protein P6P90_06725 [Ectobacillus antri]|jgi:hypothetical protein|uniref:MarR family transcriptional regulator n=1 Tax=Ectobacillus antri TaxID=2486280 RepID=A0ABT6H4C3_9BACI|nr:MULTISPECIES: hypothetical protein [Ectobacillus]MDG4658091.1 hypothetical protein [Ectobacillus antri]MDG5753668.1 hypothetical protein [Ectobacillus antri]UOY93302.1 hypothetical protein MUG87_04020 [Ectobacillus sp. JY-23]
MEKDNKDANLKKHEEDKTVPNKEIEEIFRRIIAEHGEALKMLGKS